MKKQKPVSRKPSKKKWYTANEIAYQNKDVASKVTGEALVGHSLAPLGLPHIKIVAVLTTNLPAVESNELRLDNLFLLEDEAIAIIDYESSYSKVNFVKYLNYAARVESVFLTQIDTKCVYLNLKRKIDGGEILNAEDLMQLMVLPLTVKGKERKQDVIMEAVELAKRMEDREQKLQVLAGILTFTDKVIDKNYRERVKEEWRMTQIGKMIFDDGFKEGEKQGEKRGERRGENKKLVALVCRKLRKGKTAKVIAEELEESYGTIENICQSAIEFAPDYDDGKVYKNYCLHHD